MIAVTIGLTFLLTLKPVMLVLVKLKHLESFEVFALKIHTSKWTKCIFQSTYIFKTCKCTIIDKNNVINNKSILLASSAFCESDIGQFYINNAQTDIAGVP